MTRMAEHQVVLCIQDTTELDFNGQQASGLGPLSYEAQRGMYVHPTYAISTSREPLGVLDVWMSTLDRRLSATGRNRPRADQNPSGVRCRPRGRHHGTDGDGSQ